MKNKIFILILILVFVFLASTIFYFFIGPKINNTKPVGEIPKDSCSLETCHDFNNISCGSNPPDVCTEIYMIGDKCLQYAKCGVQNGKCQQIQNTQFTMCKSCVQKCIDVSKDNTTELFECENKCN